MNNLWTKSTIEIILILITIASLLTGLGYLTYLFLVKSNIRKIKKGNKELIIGSEERKCTECQNTKIFNNIITSVIDTVTSIVNIIQVEVITSQMAYVSNNIEYVVKKLQNIFFEYLDKNKPWEDPYKFAVYSKIEAETEVTTERIILKGIREALKANHIPDISRNKEEFTKYIDNVYTGISVPMRSFLKDKNDSILTREELDKILDKWKPTLYITLENIFNECKKKYIRKLEKATKLEEKLRENVRILSDVEIQNILDK